jgi:sulfoacetaldehyde dehydrogenase
MQYVPKSRGEKKGDFKGKEFLLDYLGEYFSRRGAMIAQVRSEYDTVRGLVERGRKAQAVAESFSQRRVDELAAAIAYSVSREDTARDLATLAYEETGMGDIESKYGKLTKKIPGCFYDVKSQKTVGIIECNPEMGITKIAKPVGIIGALIPSTNPEATPVFKGMLALRGRNATIFSPHPRARKTTSKVVDVMRTVLEKNGAPADLFLCVPEPSTEISKEVMRQCDLIMATGSSEMVKAAYSMGKPSYGVGAGNACIIVDETADIEDAAQKVRIGKTIDRASGCSAENSLIIQEEIYDRLIKALIKQGGYLTSQEEKGKLLDIMWLDGKLNPDIVARPAWKIAQLAKIGVSENTAFIMVEEEGIGKGYPFSGEKMSVVLTVYKYRDFDEAIAKVNAITNYSGRGHSCGIHSFDRERILRLAMKTYTTRVTVRQPHGIANSGNWFNGLAFTFSLGCGTWGRNIVSENITQKHYINITWLAEPIARSEASEEEIYGDLLKNLKL